MKIAAVADLPLRIANPLFNVNILYNVVNDMVANEDASIIVFPEMCLTTASCRDLADQAQIRADILTACNSLQLAGTGNVLFTLNFPMRLSDSTRYAVTACIHDGCVPYSSLAPRESPSDNMLAAVALRAKGAKNSPSLTICPSAIPMHLATPAELDAFAVAQSKKLKSAFLLVNAGPYESTSEAVFFPHIAYAKDGELLSSGIDPMKPFVFDFDFPVDCDFTAKERMIAPPRRNPLLLASSQTPFIPGNQDDLNNIFLAQTLGLQKRMESSRSDKLVVGLSGGLDSTLALLAACEAAGASNVLAVGMPGFGTTKRTKNNAGHLAEKLGCDYRVIDIKSACLQHFADIGHDPAKINIVYENAQARERTQILMDLANEYNALVVGTGDLSENALGWCTYNGDHMSMYAVNASVPKTLIRALVANYAASNQDIADILQDILDTPVSPELIPSGDDSSDSVQKTEQILGAYELHDFYLYHLICLNETPKKILASAKKVFSGCYSQEEILRTLKLFLARFFTQQFKRTCAPDGPAVTPVSLSPRTGWRVPSDADPSAWLDALENS